MEITKQTALITGANRGLGRHLSQELLARGAKVYADVRNQEMIDLPGVIPIKLNITDEKSIAVAAEIAKDVTLLINNAGSNTEAALLDGEMEKIRLEMDTHFFSTLSMIRTFAPILEKNGGGTILNILSVLSWLSLNGG